ncbi:hypothetical protein FRC15_005009 [Serendipita sp. 397]|nr:hypothetical protein FRC15_005009 [Serendipita sp. 397]
METKGENGRESLSIQKGNREDKGPSSIGQKRQALRRPTRGIAGKNKDRQTTLSTFVSYLQFIRRLVPPEQRGSVRAARYKTNRLFAINPTFHLHPLDLLSSLGSI